MLAAEDLVHRFHGLENINKIAEVTIAENALLVNIDGLAKVAHIGHDIKIIGNPSLLNLNGLSSLSMLGGSSVEIYCNSQLPIRQVNQLRTRLQSFGWNYCWYTALTCAPRVKRPHGWCQCNQVAADPFMCDNPFNTIPDIMWYP